MARQWRVAKTLLTLQAQVNRAYPRRNKASDGTIGDSAHAGRTSDHNPWVIDADGIGVVTAMDLTRDTVNGFDPFVFSRLMIKDPRVKYVIFNRQIYNEAVARVWRRYNGQNPHTQHVHISVHSIQRLYDNERVWIIKEAT